MVARHSRGVLTAVLAAALVTCCPPVVHAVQNFSDTIVIDRRNNRDLAHAVSYTFPAGVYSLQPTTGWTQWENSYPTPKVLTCHWYTYDGGDHNYRMNLPPSGLPYWPDEPTAVANSPAYALSFSKPTNVQFHANSTTYADLNKWPGAVTLAVSGTTLGDFTPPTPDRPDPSSPPEDTAQYNFVLGTTADITWNPLTIGSDFSLNIPGLDPISVGGSITYPDSGYSQSWNYEFGFGTNNYFLGEALSAVAPIEGNIAEATGAAGIRGTAELQGLAFLQDGDSNMNVGVSAGLGVELYADANVKVPPLEGLPLVGKFASKDYSFAVPVAGTPTAELTAPLVDLQENFDYDQFKSDIAVQLGVLASELDDEGKETHTLGNVPITFDPTGAKGRVEYGIGLSSSVYAQTDLSAAVSVYFREGLPSGTGLTTGDELAGVLDNAVDMGSAVRRDSSTGTVVFDEDGNLGLTTGSPVWTSMLVEAIEPTNMLAFDAEFISADENAEGLLSVFWDGETIATIDERLAAEGENLYLFMLDDTYEAGWYEVTFRLDPYPEDSPSEVMIGELQLGFIPEPSAVFLLLGAAVFLLLGRRQGARR